MPDSIRHRPAPNVIWEETSGEAVLFKMDDGHYYRFNNTGTVIWKGLVNGWSSDSIMAKLAQDFGIAEDAIMEDYWIFITDLEKEGLIVVDE